MKHGSYHFPSVHAIQHIPLVRDTISQIIENCVGGREFGTQLDYCHNQFEYAQVSNLSLTLSSQDFYRIAILWDSNPDLVPLHIRYVSKSTYVSGWLPGVLTATPKTNYSAK